MSEMELKDLVAERANRAAVRLLEHRLPTDPWEPLGRDSAEEPIPKEVLHEFGDKFDTKLTVTDSAYRRIVKHVCGFPAYLGLVLHRRVREQSVVDQEAAIAARHAAEEEWVRTFQEEWRRAIISPIPRRPVPSAPLRGPSSGSRSRLEDGERTRSARLRTLAEEDGDTELPSAGPVAATGSSEQSQQQHDTPPEATYSPTDGVSIAVSPASTPSPPNVAHLRQRAHEAVTALLPEIISRLRVPPCTGEAARMAPPAGSLGTAPSLGHVMQEDSRRSAPVETELVPGIPTPPAAISVLEFVRVWTPEVHAAAKVDRFLILIEPVLPATTDRDYRGRDVPPPDNSVYDYDARPPEHADPGVFGRFDPSPIHWCRPIIPGGDFRKRRKRVYMDDIRPLVEALVDRHPDLSKLRRNPTLRSRYVTCVLVSIFASLHGQCSNDISVAEVKESNVVDAFHLCATTSTTQVLPFSVRYFEEMNAQFARADVHRNGLVNQPQVERAGLAVVCSNALERVFHGRSRLLASGAPGWFNFEDFVWFFVAQNDHMADTSLEYWFRSLDLDDDGYLGPLDLECSYENRVWQMRELGERTHPTTADAVVQLRDLIKPRDRSMITNMDIRRHGVGPIVFDLILSVQAGSAASRNYLV